MSVFWLNTDQIKHDLTQAVKRLAEKQTEIEEVWLFGSLARGEAVPGSDADLLMVLNDSDISFLNRSVRYQPDFHDIGIDLLVYTCAEVKQMQADGNPLLQQAYQEGICLFRRSEIQTSKS